MESEQLEESRGRRRSSRLLSADGKRKHPDPIGSSSGPKMMKTNEGAAVPSTVNFTFDELKHYLNGEFRCSINEDIDKSFKKLSDRVDRNQAELRTHKEQVDKELKAMRAELDSTRNPPIGDYASVAAAAPQEVGRRAGSVGHEPRRREDREAEQYWRARRSSRLFPIQGVEEDELRANLNRLL